MEVTRRRPRRVEVTIPFTHGTDLALGISLRVPRRRRRHDHALRRWGIALSTTVLLLVNLLVPPAIVLGAPVLARAAAALLASDESPASVALVARTPRPVLQARRMITTPTSADAPIVRSHVVTSGETLLSIANDHGIAPQTLAFDNGITDSAQLRVGRTLLVPPFDAAIHVLARGETVDQIADRFGADADRVRAINRVAADDGDVTEGRLLIVPVPDARYPGFRLRLSETPRVLTPRVRWPTAGVITQLFSPAHLGVDIAAPYGSPVGASEAGTVSFVGYRGPGGLAVCAVTDWGLETCDYHLSAAYVETGERVLAGQRVAAVGTTGVTTGPHVHWEARVNGAIVDPLTYATYAASPVVGGATGSP